MYIVNMINRKEVINHKSKENTYLDLVKKQEKERNSQGYIWVKKDKTTKHVSPDSLKKLLKEGWVKCS